jgi:hypothetical protein
MNQAKLARAITFHGRLAAIATALTMTAALSGCVVGPAAGPVLSRLAPDQPGGASAARPLTDAEKKRYDEIDRQVLREQNEAMAANAWARYYVPYYAPPVVYGGYGSDYRGWGGGFYSPGWWW